MTDGMLTRLAPKAGPATYDEATRSAVVTFTTGAEVARADPRTGQSYVEQLEVTEAAIDLSRLNAGAPLLSNHANDLTSVIGVVERAWIERGQGLARVRFSDRPEVAPILADVRSGVLRNVSVGYQVHAWREERTGGMLRRVATRWTPLEISLVPIPADAAAQVRLHPAIPTAPARKDVTMPDDMVKAAAEMPAANDSEAAERLRAASIAKMALIWNVPPQWAADHIARGTDLATARHYIMTREPAGGAGFCNVTPVDPIGGGTSRAVDSAAEYVAARLVGRQPHGAAYEYRNMSVLDVAADHANRTRNAGYRTGALSADDVRRLTSSDVPLLTESGASRAALELYPTVRTGLLATCRIVNLPDFRPRTMIRLAQHKPLDQVFQGGEVTAEYPTEAGENIALAEYANAFPMTERVLINDDLDAIGTWLRAAMQAAAARERLLIAGLLTAGGGVGPTMSDGNPWFHASRSNIAVSVALGVASLGAAVAQMRALRDGVGETIYGLEPGFLIVSPALEMTARQLVADLSTVTTRGDVQPYSLSVIVEPALTGARWWIAPTLASRACLAAGYLDTQQTPRVETFADPNVLGVTVRVSHRMAAAVVDPMGWVTNAGV